MYIYEHCSFLPVNMLRKNDNFNKGTETAFAKSKASKTPNIPFLTILQIENNT